MARVRYIFLVTFLPVCAATVDYFWSSLVTRIYSILKPHNFNNSNQRSAYGCNNAKNDNFDRKNSKQLLHLLLLQIKKVVIFFLQAPTNNKGVLNTTPPPLAFLNSHCLDLDLNYQKLRCYWPIGWICHALFDAALQKGSQDFLFVRSSAWSFGHSDPDPSSLNFE